MDREDVGRCTKMYEDVRRSSCALLWVATVVISLCMLFLYVLTYISQPLNSKTFELKRSSLFHSFTPDYSSPSNQFSCSLRLLTIQPDRLLQSIYFRISPSSSRYLTYRIFRLIGERKDFEGERDRARRRIHRVHWWW